MSSIIITEKNQKISFNTLIMQKITMHIANTLTDMMIYI